MSPLSHAARGCDRGARPCARPVHRPAVSRPRTHPQMYRLSGATTRSELDPEQHPLWPAPRDSTAPSGRALMPHAPGRACLEPGCPSTAGPRGRCPSHARAYDHQRGTAAQRGYASPEHQAWRRAVILRDGSCADCQRPLFDARGEPLPIAHADHVVPISRGGARLDPKNGRARCDRCHGRKTIGEQRPVLQAARSDKA